MSGRFAGLARTAVHVSMGGFAFLLRFLSPVQAAGMAVAALLFNWFALHPLTGGRLLRAGEPRHSFRSGIVLYPAAVLALILVFWRNLHIAAGAWALLAAGDGMAAGVGRAWNGRKLSWNPGKSWAGLVAFVVFGSAAAAVLVEWVGRGAVADVRVLVGGCLAAALLAGLAESLPTAIDDNVTVPLVGGAVLYAAFLVEPILLAASADRLRTNLIVGLVVNLVFAAAAWAARGVRASGVVAGVAVGTTVYTFAGLAGFALLLAFFVLGTAATRVGFARKAALGIAQERGGRRGAREAFANGSAAAAFAFLSVATFHSGGFRIALAAALATAAADTVSSEIGQAFGRRHLLATTFRRVPAGTDGAISFEGTLAGLFAAALLAALAVATGFVGPAAAAVIVVAAAAGNYFESVLGATLERSLRLGNELVNFANTLFGGLLAYALARLMHIA